ncbi:hypothetical protein [Specibacter cremeus]
MIQRMFVGEREGSHDRLLDVSTAATGTVLFAPTGKFLESVAG